MPVFSLAIVRDASVSIFLGGQKWPSRPGATTLHVKEHEYSKRSGCVFFSLVHIYTRICICVDLIFSSLHGYVHTVYASSSIILLRCVRLCQFAWDYLFVFVLFVCVVCVHPCVHFLVCITHLRRCENWKFKFTIWNDNGFILKLQAALTSQKESQTPETITTSVIYKNNNNLQIREIIYF